MTQTQTISGIYNAMQHFRQEVKRLEGLNVVSVKQVFRYCWHVKTVDWLKDPDAVASFFVFLKRDHFRTFSDHFPNLPAEYRGLGQTVTLEALTYAIHTGKNSYIIIVMEDGAIYYQSARLWYDFADLYQTKRPASNSGQHDLEASIPLKLLKRLNSV
jgi:hypothetical protein